MLNPQTPSKRCNFCFHWFECQPKYKCQLLICRDCFKKCQHRMTLGCPDDTTVYELGIWPTAMRSDEQQLLLTEADEHKAQAYEELRDKFKSNVDAIVAKYHNCRRKLELLEPYATFEELKQIVESLDQKENDRDFNTDDKKKFRETISFATKDESISGMLTDRSIPHTFRLKRASDLHREQNQNTFNISHLRASLKLKPSALLKQHNPFLKQAQTARPNLQQSKLQTALQSTLLHSCTLQLISFKLPATPGFFRSYLNSVDWADIDTVRFVKVGLTDHHFKTLLQALESHPRVTTLVLSNNQLTSASLEKLQNAEKLYLRNVYLGNNLLYLPRAKQIIRALRNRLNVYV